MRRPVAQPKTCNRPLRGRRTQASPPPRSRWVLCAPGSEQGAFRPAANLNHAERSPHVMKFLLKYEKAVDIVLVLRQHQDCKWFYAIRVITKSNPLTRHPKHT